MERLRTTPEDNNKKERGKWMVVSGAIAGGGFGTLGGPLTTLLGLAVGGTTGYLLDRFIRNQETNDIPKRDPTS